MKTALNISRVFVGVLFIFSGLVKANDPLGLSYKMQEFFEVWNEGLASSSLFISRWLIHFLTYLHEHSLALSIIMIAFEIVAGVALLLGWKMKLFSWLLLLLIIFFTFLTGYAFLSGKFRSCGCFGDCLPITPLTSFLKDVLLVLLILFLFFNRQKIKPLFSRMMSGLLMLIAVFLSLGFQWYVLNNLPIVDCLPFKKGNNIAQLRKPPPNAIPDSTVITFQYEKDGKLIEFTTENFPEDFDDSIYHFKKRFDKLIRKGNDEPSIKGFYLNGMDDSDSTDIVLAMPQVIILFCENFSTPVSAWQKQFEPITAIAAQKNIPVYFVTSAVEDAHKKLQGTAFSSMPILKCDYTAIRTAARANPTLYFLKKGTIIGKWSYKNFSVAEKELIKETTNQP